MNSVATTLLRVIRSGEALGDRAFAYIQRSKNFKAASNILVVQIGIVVGTGVTWTIVIGMILQFRNFGEAKSGILLCIALAVLSTAYTAFTFIRYPRELRSLAEHLNHEVRFRQGSYGVLVGPDQLAAEFVSLKRGSPLVYDMASGLNVWRLHLRVEGADVFFDPSKMVEVSRPTPYPR